MIKHTSLSEKTLLNPINLYFQQKKDLYSPNQIEASISSLQALLKGIDPEIWRCPQIGPGADKSLCMAWDSKDHHLDIEISKKGDIEWFFRIHSKNLYLGGWDFSLDSQKEIIGFLIVLLWEEKKDG